MVSPKKVAFSYLVARHMTRPPMRVTEEDRSVPSAFRSGAIICIESWPKSHTSFEPFLLLKMHQFSGRTQFTKAGSGRR